MIVFNTKLTNHSKTMTIPKGAKTLNRVQLRDYWICIGSTAFRITKFKRVYDTFSVGLKSIKIISITTGLNCGHF